MSKQFLTAHELHQRLDQLFTLERKTTAQIVECLLEVKRRRVYLEFGYTGLFSYLTKHFKHTEATAQRWIECVRMTEKVPEISHDLKSGSLNQTQVCMIAQSVREKEKQGGSVDTKELLPQVRNQTAAQTQVIISKALDLAPKRHEKKSYQQDESIRFEITLTKEQMTQVNRVKELLSHKYPHLSMAELISVMAEEVIQKRDPLVQKGRSSGAGNRLTSKLEVESQSKIETQSSNVDTFKMKVPHCKSVSAQIGSLPVKNETYPKFRRTSASKLEASSAHFATPASAPMGTLRNAAPRSIRKSIPRAVRRAIHQRDLCCQWKIGDNQICGSKFQLQLDHIQSRWAGGVDGLSNLQLLCAVHNRRKYQLEARIKRP